MIKDLQLMKDITPLFEKKIVIWGVGKKGQMIIEDMIAMGAGKRGIFFCDSNPGLWGELIAGSRVLSPDELKKEIDKVDLSDVMVLVTVMSVQAQDEIIKEVENLWGDSVDIYTEYAIEWGLYLGLKNSYIEDDFRKKKLIEHKENKMLNSREAMVKEEALKYFALLPLYNDEIILVYQPGKCGSLSVYKSIQNYNRYVLHCHALTDIGNNDNDLNKILDMKSGKIISLVRDPVARRISEMWECIENVGRYSVEVDFQEIEKFYFNEGWENEEFQWFFWQMKNIFKIDVFEYPFDREKGYTIIKKGNIELLLMKMENLNELEAVIGKFLNIEQFQLMNDNIGRRKPYRFALQAYKDNFRISQEKLEQIYKKNEYMKHFYSEDERNEMYLKWMEYIK